MSAGVHARTRSGRVTLRCHNRNPRWETGLGVANDITHQKCAEDFGGFEKKSEELSLAVRRRRVTFASLQRPCGGCHTCWGWGLMEKPA